MTASDQVATLATVDPSWVAIAGLLLTGLIFPFVLHFFKKHETLHEALVSKLGEHSATLVVHEYRLISLEEWKKYQTQGTAPPVTTVVNH